MTTNRRQVYNELAFIPAFGHVWMALKLQARKDDPWFGLNQGPKIASAPVEGAIAHVANMSDFSPEAIRKPWHGTFVIVAVSP